MKVGDLLVSRTVSEEDRTVILLILDIKKHPHHPNRDKFCLQWVSRNGGKTLRGEFSRLMVEKRYKVT